jgi:hypothetical protein
MEQNNYTQEHSETIDKLATDLSQLQGELSHVAKDSKGYGYNYSSLPDTLDNVKPLMLKYGFSLSQYEDGNGNLVTLLLHKSGQWIKGRMKLIEIEMKGTNAAQNKGSVLSYFRRYSIQSILGMAAEDSDGTTKGGNDRPAPQIRKETPKQESKPEPVVTTTDSRDLTTTGRGFRKNTTKGSEDL